MKKLLSIIVLGLLLSGSVYALDLTKTEWSFIPKPLDDKPFRVQFEYKGECIYIKSGNDITDMPCTYYNNNRNFYLIINNYSFYEGKIQNNKISGKASNKNNENWRFEAIKN